MTRYTPLWEQQGSYAASVDRRLIGSIWPSAASVGCAVTVSSGMTVNVAAGQVSVPTGNNTGSVLCASDAVEPVTLAAAPGSGTNRYDLVICQARGNDLDGGSNNDFIFTTVTGTAAASPTVPATPANAVALAQIYVPGGSASVTAGNISDVRPAGLAGSAFGGAIFANVAARNAAWPNPPNGATCITVDTNTEWQRINGVWYPPFQLLARVTHNALVSGVGSGGFDFNVTGNVAMPVARRVRVIGALNYDGSGTFVFSYAKYTIDGGSLVTINDRLGQQNANVGGRLSGDVSFLCTGVKADGTSVMTFRMGVACTGTINLQHALQEGWLEVWDAGAA